VFWPNGFPLGTCLGLSLNNMKAGPEVPLAICIHQDSAGALGESSQ